MLDDLIELSTTFINPQHQPNISPLGTPASPSRTIMPPRARAHSKTKSISSDVNSSSPAPKIATPARRAPRTSAASPPSSPGFAPAYVLPRRQSQIPTPLQFPLVVVLSFALSSLLFSLIAEFTSGDLASISKHTESWVEITGLLGWKVVELGIYWFGGFDALDVISLSIILGTPHTLLLNLFFNISPYTLILTNLANIISTATPFFLLRSISAPHAPASTPPSLLRNRSILKDQWTRLSTSLLATAIFAVAAELSFATFLPTFLITHFTGLRSLDAAHEGASGLLTLLVALIPAGFACMVFLFLPSTGVANAYLRSRAFEPATASFVDHVYHNAWGWYSARQKELITRTTLASLMVMAECVIQVWGTIEGVELLGAAGYAGVFGAAVAVVGMVYEWVGGPSG